MVVDASVGQLVVLMVTTGVDGTGVDGTGLDGTGLDGRGLDGRSVDAKGVPLVLQKVVELTTEPV